MRISLLILFLFPLVKVCAQYWEEVSFPSHWPYQIRSMYADEESGRLWIGGWINSSYYNNESLHMCYWDGSEMTCLDDEFGSVILAITKFQGNIYVGGMSHTLNDMPCRLARFDGEGFVPVANCNGTIWGLDVVDDYLVVSGSFTEIEGIPFNRIARFDGTTWSEMPGSFAPSSIMSANGVARFNDAYVVFGNFYNYVDGQEYRLISQYINGAWQPMGNALQGIAPFDLEVFQGSLYLGGDFSVLAGNAGNMIQRWDGNSWHAVGGHLTDEFNSFSYTASVTDFQIYHDKLYMCGRFDFAGGMPAEGFVAWDGERYCSLPGIAQGATCMAVFQDELYCAASRIIENGDTIQYLGRYTGGDYLVDCTTVDVAEQGDAHSEGVTLFPNPLDEHLSIRWPVDFAVEELMITDIAGRVVLHESIPPQSQSFHMNVAMLAPGTYVVHLRNRGAWQKAGRVVK